MIRKYIAIFSLFLLLTPVAYAEGNIIFSIPQKDYYFLVGEQAYIPLNITNSGNNDINGILGYTLTQEINSGSVHFSSSNSKSTNLQVSKGNSTVNLGFGTSDKPETLNVSLNFNYDDNGSKVVNLATLPYILLKKNPISKIRPIRFRALHRKHPPHSKQQIHLHNKNSKLHSKNSKCNK